jgi:hypothetical protein
MVGQAATCPHCQQPIILGSKPKILLWSLLTAGALITLAGSGLLFWHLGRRTSRNHETAENPTTTKVFEPLQPTPSVKPQLSQEDRDIETLCRQYYDKSNQRDYAALRELFATPCKDSVSPEELRRQYTGGFAYRFIALESVTYSQAGQLKLARAQVRRDVQNAAADFVAVREFKCIREPEGWRLFRDREWMGILIFGAAKEGLSERVHSEIKRFTQNDPFDTWPANETNALRRMFETLNPGLNPVFPWDISFLVETNFIDSLFLKVVFTLRNNAPCDWDNGTLTLMLKPDGKMELEDTQFLPNIASGAEIRRESQFLQRSPTETAHYKLDVSYHLGPDRFFLVANVPITFALRNLAQSLKFEVVKTDFTTATIEGTEGMTAARVYYRVTNITPEPLKSVQLKFVWFSMKGEVISQTTEYVVGYGDLPLNLNQAKSGFADCGISYRYARVPLRVDIYLEDGERRWLLRRGLLVQ